MKVTIEIDCTPVEARQFLGLPNVEPMQDAVMQQLGISPETLIKNWLAVGPPGTEQMRDYFRGVFSPPKTASE